MRFRPAIIFLILFSGCAHAPIAPIVPMPPLPERKAGGGGTQESAAVTTPVPTFRIPEIDLGWLESDGLIPPGAKSVRGSEVVPYVLMQTPRAKFPSSEVCKSPDEEWLLLNEAFWQQRKMAHILHAFQKGAPRATDVYTTEFFYDVMWSPASKLVAVTEYTGRNNSEIFLVNVPLLQKSGYLDAGPALEPFFSDEQRSWPRFQKTYRWSDAGVIVRGVARALEPPFDQIGYEVLYLVNDVPSVTKRVFLRGYLKRDKS